MNTVVDPDLEVEAIDIPISISKRRTKGTFAITIPTNMRSTIATEYSKGQTLAQVSETYMIAIPVLREYLSELNILRARGQSTKARGRKRSTVTLTDALYTQAKSMLNTAGGIVKTAKLLNLNVVELTAALHADNISRTRGRAKKTIA